MLKKTFNCFVLFCFCLVTVIPPQAFAAGLVLPEPGTMISLSKSYEPTIIKGLVVDQNNPFLFNFIVDPGQDELAGDELKEEGEKLIKYFLASLAIPEKDVWVNLSPYEQDKTIPEALAQTDMGRDLLEQDYILKQLTASLIYPEKQLGKTFWDKVYAKALAQYGTTDVPMDAFNKVWIMADRAEVFEKGQTVFVVDQHLKVMLEEDYLALQKNKEAIDAKGSNVAPQIVREIILPALEEEINNGKNFAKLRQIFNSMILANWYKKNLKQTLLNQVYADKSKVKGIDLNDPRVKAQIYNLYIDAYKKGVFNYIKDDVDATNGKVIPRKYFSGGIRQGAAANPTSNPDEERFESSLPKRKLVAFHTGVDNEPPVDQSKIEPVILPRERNVPGFRNVKPGELYLQKFSKLYPLTMSFLNFYGGNNPEYGIVREIARYMEDNNVEIIIAPKTTDPYVDIDSEKKQIILNADFLEFLFKTGRKKIYMSLIAGAVLRMRDGANVETSSMELLLTGGKKSLISGNKTRLDDAKQIYQLKRQVRANDESLQGAENPKFLNDEDVELFISDVLHQGRILDARRLVEYLKNEFGYYGVRDLDREKAGRLLEKFKDANNEIVVVRETVIKQNDDKIRGKLEPGTKIQGIDTQVQGSEKKTVTYSLKSTYTPDPAFKGRITIWDFEVERQDEVDFGGKVAHTGEMMFVPHIVTLPNFSSSGSTFQKIFEFNTISGYLNFINEKRAAIEQFIGTHEKELSVPASELSDNLEHELNALRIVVEDSEVNVIDQVRNALDSLNVVISDLQKGSYGTLKDYFKQEGDKLDQEIASIKTQRSNLEAMVRELNINKEQNQDKLTEANARLDELQQHFEQLSSTIANKLLVAARFLQVAPEISNEMKSNLRVLAARIGISLDKLLLAIRSSAVGEDSEEASFAGRQDTYIFQRPIPTSGDAEGLDNIIVSWIFNQASLFNKRAIDYRLDYGLPTFDEHVQISTLFQEMFLSEKSFIGFSVDRESGAPVMSMSITEGQGEALVSGRESGSKFITSYDGKLLLRQKGERRYQIVGTKDGLGKETVAIPEEQRREFAVTDQQLLKQTAEYFKYLHDYYGSYVDLEGAFRVMRNENGEPLVLRGPDGSILRDERGFPRYSWVIASTQVRPETVFNAQDSDIVPLRRVVVTESAYDKAVSEKRVLNLNFIAKTIGTAQGKIVWVTDKSPESLASARDKIMFTVQSDPDMTSAMVKARGIVALQGGPNSHTMIVAAEYDLVAMTGIEGATLETLMKLLPNGTEVTLDAERGKILLGVDHELAIAGKDFNARDIPDTQAGEIRSSTIVASVNKALKQWALNKIPSYKGIGLLRLELALESIGIYPEYLLAYDNLKKQEKGEAFSGPVLDAVQDAEGIKRVEATIAGYNSAEDFYVSVLSEWVTAMAETLIPSYQEVLVRAQSLKDPSLRLKIISIVSDYFKKGLGYQEPLYALKGVLTDELSIAKASGSVVQPGSDIDTLAKIIGLVDKRLYIRLDDRKSDEYGAVFGADRFVKREINPMKGYRGLDLMLRTPETLGWQLRAIKAAAEAHRSKMGIFAPVVRRPQDVKKLLDMMDEMGLTSDLVKRGIMTELPTNSVNIEDFIATGVDFVSTGGNDGLQTVGRVDRNTSSKALKESVTGYSLSVLRWNAQIIKGIKNFYALTKKFIEAGFCGNDPSVRGQENYGVILSHLGYDSVSVIIDAYESVAKNVTRKDFVIPDVAEDAKGFDLSQDREALETIRTPDFEILDVTKFRLGLGRHYRAVNDYRARFLAEVEKAYEQAQSQGKSLTVALDNGFSTQYRALAEGEKYEEEEPNPDYGYQGLVRLLDREIVEKAKISELDSIDGTILAELIRNGVVDNISDREVELKPDLDQKEGLVREIAKDKFEQIWAVLQRSRKDIDIFRLELSAIKEVMARHGNKGVVLLARSVRDHKEIDRLKSILKENEINVPVGVDVEVAANIFEMSEILNKERGVSFVSVLNPRRLTSDMMALEQNNINGIEITADDVNYQLDRPVVHIATLAKQAEIPFYLDSSVKPQPLNISLITGPAGNAVAAGLKGGIDLNTSSMNWKIRKDSAGNGVAVDLDPAMIERVKLEGMDWAKPVIFQMTPVADVWSLVGVQAVPLSQERFGN